MLVFFAVFLKMLCDRVERCFVELQVYNKSLEDTYSHLLCDSLLMKALQEVYNRKVVVYGHASQQRYL